MDDIAQLRAEHEALIQFLYLAPVGLVQADIDGSIVMMNPISAQLLMPLSRDGGLDNLFTALEGVAPELRHLCAAYDRPSGKICDGLHVHLNAGGAGKKLPQILAISLLKLDARRLMAVIDDVTLQVRRDRQLRQNDAWLNAILTGITDYALVGLDANGAILEWNPSIGRVTGFGQDAVGQAYSIFYPADAMTPEHLLDRLRDAERDGWSLDEGKRVRADGSAFWGSVLIAPLPEREPPCGTEPEGPAFCLILRDITDKRDASERRRREAFGDYLTGLANRRAFFEAAEQELTRSNTVPRPTAVIAFDADHFKTINDRFGHPGGDAVLQHLAAILGETFREVDVVARIGGEEFAVLLPSTDLPRAAVVAERLRSAVASQVVHFEGQRIRYTVSAGVASLDDGAGGIDLLLKRADQALYAAKRAGRNRVERWRAELACAPGHQPEGDRDAA
ncbi:sensor domain-containing diguanylate cyclase [Massilia sp. IC2-477]|uniref:sensor domain-containing diguanylate cyclase n=1 Tax=unclassified Massilia TaxID=2609279 RepID=UPI001D0FA05A|nr:MULTISPECIES: sensor domain-containing diguanylate cyclase [unclassified Massilia]MCC2955411.1 sensor domain-containing diguanylate cyclase [Massilia sp. IC2-477]MCC2974562.1 sensor domain-containing diguanylate cyclase [Massilia sp. IC2-476]